MTATAPMQSALFRPFPSGPLQQVHGSGAMAYIDGASEKFVSERAADCAPLPGRPSPGAGQMDVQADFIWADSRGRARVGQAAVWEDPEGEFHRAARPPSISQFESQRSRGMPHTVASPEEALALCIEVLDGLPSSGEDPADLIVAVWRKGELAANAERVVKAGGGITAEEIAAALKESGIFAAVAAAPPGGLPV